MWVQCGQNISCPVLSKAKAKNRREGGATSAFRAETTYIKFVTILLSSLARGHIIENINRGQLHFLHCLVLS